jgi:hypothetical protein
MDTDAITAPPLKYWERSQKRRADADKCLWACAMRLMEANDPDAPAHISMVGNRIGLPDSSVSTTIKNAAKRTHWKPTAIAAEASNSDVSEMVEHTRKAYLDDCPACVANMGLCGQESLMQTHAAANHMTFDEMWNNANDAAWAL